MYVVWGMKVIVVLKKKIKSHRKYYMTDTIVIKKMVRKKQYLDKCIL